MPTDQEPKLSYSQAVARLEEILDRIERGEVDIDELSTLVEEAAGLVTLCREKLTRAEVQVKKITERLEALEAAGEAQPEGEVPF